MIADTRKKAIFQACLHDLRKEQYGDNLEDYLKEHQNTLCSLIVSETFGEYITEEQYKIQLQTFLRFILQFHIEQHIIPNRDQYRSQLATCMTNLDNLENDILTNIIDLTQIPKDRFIEWGGAGVIVTAEPFREAAEGDVVVSTRHAHVITWFMERVRDIATDCVDYTNKYEFYGMIAEKTREFIEKHGDPEGQEKILVLDVLRNVKRLIHTWQEHFEA